MDNDAVVTPLRGTRFGITDFNHDTWLKICVGGIINQKRLSKP
jgi:hypothetical protein